MNVCEVVANNLHLVMHVICPEVSNLVLCVQVPAGISHELIDSSLFDGADEVWCDVADVTIEDRLKIRQHHELGSLMSDARQLLEGLKFGRRVDKSLRQSRI